MNEGGCVTGGIGAPEVSVVIPCRNVGRTLSAQLGALERQRGCGAFEVIVVDHGSTDDTVQVAESFLRAHPSWRVVTAPSRPGINVARNAGISAAVAPLVALCDGDDVVSDRWLAALIDGLSSADLVGGFVYFGETPSAQPSESSELVPRLPTLFGHAFPHGGCMAFKKRLWLDLDGFDEAFSLGGSDEAEFARRAERTGCEIGVVQDAFVWYRQRAGLRPMMRQRRGNGRGAAQLWDAFHGQPEWRSFRHSVGAFIRAVGYLVRSPDRRTDFRELLSYVSFEWGRFEYSIRLVRRPSLQRGRHG